MFELYTKDRKTGKFIENKSKNTIIKFDGRDRFVEVAQAFALGKIKFSFRQYDDSKPSGNKITNQIDCYISVEEAAFLGKNCSSGRLFTAAQRNEKLRAKSNYPNAKPCYENFSGTEKNGKVISRHLQIQQKARTDKNFQKIPFSLMAQECDGFRTSTGAITPAKNGNSKPSYIVLGLTADQIVKLGIALERAVSIYDQWIALGVLNKRTQALRVGGSANQQQNSNQNAPQNNRPAPNQQGNSNQPQLSNQQSGGARMSESYNRQRGINQEASQSFPADANGKAPFDAGDKSKKWNQPQWA